MSDRAKSYGVLFLCTGNSARSLLAEAALSRLGAGRFRAYSAGSDPKPAPHPVTLEVLAAEGYSLEGFRSKSWDEFSGAEAPALDFVFTVCGNAARESCPVWSGRPMQAHWGVDDPAAFVGSEESTRAVFAETYRRLATKIRAFVELDLPTLAPETLRARLDAIGALGASGED